MYNGLQGNISSPGRVQPRQLNILPYKLKTTNEQWTHKSRIVRCWAAYQIKIIQYCEEQTIDYAIRAKMSAGIKEHIEAQEENDWHPLILHKNGEVSQSTCRTVHWMTDHETPLT